MPIFPFRVTAANPQPVVSSRKYHHTGIGGRGNYKKISKDTLPQTVKTSAVPSTSSVAPSVHELSSQPRTFASGRGGAGNRSLTSESAIFTFDEELERLRRTSGAAPVYHVGRGGAGNHHDDRKVGMGRGRQGSIDSLGSEGDESGLSRRSLEWMSQRLGVGTSSSSGSR